MDSNLNSVMMLINFWGALILAHIHQTNKAHGSSFVLFAVAMFNLIMFMVTTF